MQPILAALAFGASTLASAAPRFAEIRLSTGIRLHYAEDGPSAGTPVIVLHGYSDSWFSFSRVMPLLAREARVYALDLRGHGNSDRPASGYRMGDLAADVLAFMDAKGIARATILGHSMGGLVAQQVALAAPQRVSRLILVSTARTVRGFDGVDELGKAIESLPEPVPPEFVREFQTSTVHVPVPDAFMDRVVAESLRLPARVWRELLAGMLATEPAVALGRSGIPTLLVWGEKDAYIPRTAQDELIAMIGTATLTVYTGTGHAPHWERPADVARDVLAFVKGG